MIDDDGLHLMIEDKPVGLDVDTVIICAGQEPLRELFVSSMMVIRALRSSVVLSKPRSSMQKRRLIRRVGRQRNYKFKGH